MFFEFGSAHWLGGMLCECLLSCMNSNLIFQRISRSLVLKPLEIERMCMLMGKTSTLSRLMIRMDMSMGSFNLVALLKQFELWL